MSRLLFSIHALIHALHRWGVPILPSLLCKLLIRVPFGCQIGPSTRMGRGTVLAYGGLGVVIHDRAVIGNRCYIGSCVTIGGTSGKSGVPTIGDDVIIYSGAKIIGGVTIGDGSVVGANSVVTRDVPPRCVVAGVPARLLKTDIRTEDYRTPE